MKYHPDVLAVHAEFGGDLQSMQALYDRPDHIARIAALEAQLAERVKVKGLHVAYFDDGQFHWMSGIAPRNCELYALEATPPAPKVTKAMVEAALKSLHENPVSWESRSAIRAALTAAQEAGKP